MKKQEEGNLNANKRNSSKPKAREIEYLEHFNFSDGYFIIRTREGEALKVEANLHELRLCYAEWNSEDQCWDCDGEDKIIEHFYLTDLEEGYQFQESDVKDYFQVEVNDFYWEFGVMPHNNSCGIKEFEPITDAKKKWGEYRNRFPKLTSKNQFNCSINEENFYSIRMERKKL